MDVCISCISCLSCISYICDVCVYVYVYMCVCVLIYIYTYMCVYICIQYIMCMWVCAYVCVCVCVRVCVCVCICVQYVYVYNVWLAWSVCFFLRVEHHLGGLTIVNQRRWSLTAVGKIDTLNSIMNRTPLLIYPMTYTTIWWVLKTIPSTREEVIYQFYQEAYSFLIDKQIDLDT
jgi:hypothetical protein